MLLKPHKHMTDGTDLKSRVSALILPILYLSLSQDFANMDEIYSQYALPLSDDQSLVKGSRKPRLQWIASRKQIDQLQLSILINNKLWLVNLFTTCDSL